MKRIVSLLLCVAIVLSVMGITGLTVFAATNELVTNGGFESADISGFTGADHSRVSSEYSVTPKSGSYMLKASQGDLFCDVAEQFGCYQQIQGGIYRLDYTVNAQVYARSAIKMRVYVKYLRIGDNCAQFLDGGTVDVPAGSWTSISFTKPLYGAPNANIASADIVFSATGNYYLDDVSLTNQGSATGKTRPADIAVGNSATTGAITVDTAEKSEDPTFGAIRWDAWYGNDANASSIAYVVSKTLSSKNGAYLDRAPFFASIQNKQVVLPTYTQEICDKEILYAASAGIDYFIYGWYDDGMRAARVFHTTSQYREKVKMAIIACGSRFEHIEMYEMLKQDYYMKVLGNRPLIFINTKLPETVEKITTYYRNMCLDLKNQGYDIGYPYITVYYNNVSDTTKIKEMYASGADAVTDYAFEATGSVSNLSSYASLASKAEAQWTTRESRIYNASTQQIVPTVTLGYDLSPRYYAEQATPGIVHWMSVPSNGYAAKATAAELENHMTNAVRYMLDASNASYTSANTVSIYAWNEHDEGGWLCPTVKVDANGNQLYNADGTPQIDTSRLDAVGKAIKAYKKSGTYCDNGIYETNFENGIPSVFTGVTAATVTGGGNVSAQAVSSLSLNIKDLTELLASPAKKYCLSFDCYSTAAGQMNASVSARLSGNAADAAEADGLIGNNGVYTFTANAASVSQNSWSKQSFELRIPEYFKNADDLKITVNCTHGQHIYIDSLKICAIDSIAGAALSLGKTLSLEYYAYINDENAVPTMRFVRERAVAESTETAPTLVQGTLDEATGLWKFTFDGINPQCMTDNICAELIVNGETVDVKERYSVKQYCMDQHESTAQKLGISNIKFTQLKNLLAAILNYGSEAQKYTGYKTKQLANAGVAWARDTVTLAKPESIKEKTVLSGDGDHIRAAGVRFDNGVELYFKVFAPDPQMTLVVSDEYGNSKTYGIGELDTDGITVIYTDVIFASRLGEKLTATLYGFGGTALESVTYSAYSYASQKWESNSLVRAMYAYGLNAEKYASDISEGFDVDIDDEDIF